MKRGGGGSVKWVNLPPRNLPCYCVLLQVAIFRLLPPARLTYNEVGAFDRGRWGVEVGGWRCKWGKKDELTPLVFGKTLLRGYCITGEPEVGQEFELAGRCWATVRIFLRTYIFFSRNVGHFLTHFIRKLDIF